MYELIQVGPRSYYINAPVKIGLSLLQDNQVCLIDSGNDKDAGRKIRQLLEQHGWQLQMILNTHSNADHIGGNQYLQKQTGCHIYAPGIECALTRHPLLEPSYLYGGFPPKDLRHKFLLAQPSQAEYLTDDVLPKGWKMLPLPGHFFNMVGFETEDGVIYLADCLSSKETLAKYQIGVLYDVGPTWIHCSGSKPSVPTALFPPTQRPQTTLLLWPNITLTTPTKWRSTSLPCAKSPSALNICCKNCSISIT